MDREKLESLVKKREHDKVKHISRSEADKLMKKMHDYHDNHFKGGDVMIAIEEMAELTQVLSKLIRGKITKDDIGLLEEIVDVKCGLYEIGRNVFHLGFMNYLLDDDYNEEDMKLLGKKLGDMFGDDYSDLIFMAMKRMSKLQNKLSETLYHHTTGNASFDLNFRVKFYKLIMEVDKDISDIIFYFDLDKEKMKYIVDVKMERTRERVKNGTD